MHRRQFLPIGAATVAGLAHAGTASAQQGDIMTPEQRTLLRAIYEGFAQNDLKRWDPVVHPEVVLYSSGAWGVPGIDGLKAWATAFHTAFRPRIDLVDEFAAGDRAWIMISMHWKHDFGEFFGVKPTGRAGTSVELFLFRVRDGQVVQWNVADNSLDLGLYLWERGFPLPHNIVPPTLVEG
jgi:hypothetical protein